VSPPVAEDDHHGVGDVQRDHRPGLEKGEVTIVQDCNQKDDSDGKEDDVSEERLSRDVEWANKGYGADYDRYN
jgi:hypothetical protein